MSPPPTGSGLTALDPDPRSSVLPPCNRKKRYQVQDGGSREDGRLEGRSRPPCTYNAEKFRVRLTCSVASAFLPPSGDQRALGGADVRVGKKAHH